MRTPRLGIGLGSLLVALLIVVAVGIGSAIAVIPNNGTYYACLTKKTGAVKVINYPKVQCAQGQRLIKWNAKGPAGPAGPAGVQGAQGVQGPVGPAGEAGITKIALTTVEGEVENGGAVGHRDAAVATCPAGRVVGGGFSQDGEGMRIIGSLPVGTNAWKVIWVVKDPPGSLTLRYYAICMTTEPSAVIATSKVKVATKKGK